MTSMNAPTKRTKQPIAPPVVTPYAYPSVSPTVTPWIPTNQNLVCTSNQTSSYVPGAQLLNALSQSSGKG